MEWETGNPPYLGLTPNVVFCNGIEQIDVGASGGNDYLMFYGGNKFTNCCH